MSSELLPGGGAINGRRWAGLQLLRLWSELTNGQDLNLLVADHALGDQVDQLLRGCGAPARVSTHSLLDVEPIEMCGSLMIPDPGVGLWSHWRDATSQPATLSLIGQTHTLCTVGAMTLLERIVSDNVFSWDALICSSSAGRDVVHKVFEQQEERLATLAKVPKSRLIAHRPQLPIIPLPMPVNDIQNRLPSRIEARQQLGLPTNAHVILWLGRLSLLAKADLAPTYQILERLASKQSRKVILIELGPNSTPDEAASLERLRKRCNFLQFLRLGGDQSVSESVKYQALASADLAISLVDNVQETFGQSLVEAMAAGLPIVASDWDGYRDLVHNGRDGFLVPTSWAQISTEVSCRLGWQHRLGIVPYQTYAGALSQMVRIDLEVAFSALMTLLGDSALCRAMGAAAAKTAYRKFDCSVVIRSYQELFKDLDDRRRSTSQSWRQAVNPPLSIDPVKCFWDFASSGSTLGNSAVSQSIESCDFPQELLTSHQHLWRLLELTCPIERRQEILQAIWHKHHFHC